MSWFVITVMGCAVIQGGSQLICLWAGLRPTQSAGTLALGVVLNIITLVWASVLLAGAA